MKAGRPSPIGRGSVRADSCQDPSVMRSSMKTNQTLASPFTLKVNLSVESASCTAVTAGESAVNQPFGDVVGSLDGGGGGVVVHDVSFRGLGGLCCLRRH